MKWLKRIGLVVTAIITISLLILLILGHRANAGRAHTSIEIAASPEQLWAWVEDGDKLKRWVSWMVEARAWDRAPGFGAKRTLEMTDENNGGIQMRIESTLMEYDPPSLMTVGLSVPGAFDGTQTYHFTRVGFRRTRMDVDSRFRFINRFAALMEPLIIPQAKKKMIADLAHLKSLVESK